MLFRSEIYDDSTQTYTSTNQHLVNLSCLQYVQAKSAMSAGFVIAGTTAQTVLIRACGPSLVGFGVTSVIPNPTLTLYNSSSSAIASNTGWGANPAISSAVTLTGAFSFASPTSLDAALLVTLEPGAYSVVSSSATGLAGFELIEIYEVK